MPPDQQGQKRSDRPGDRGRDAERHRGIAGGVTAGARLETQVDDDEPGDQAREGQDSHDDCRQTGGPNPCESSANSLARFEPGAVTKVIAGIADQARQGRPA